MYIHEIGRMLAEPNWAADTAPWPALGRFSVPVAAMIYVAKSPPYNPSNAVVETGGQARAGISTGQRAASGCGRAVIPSAASGRMPAECATSHRFPPDRNAAHGITARRQCAQHADAHGNATQGKHA